MALVYLSSSWVLGIFLGAKFSLPLGLIFIGLIPLVLLFFFRQHRKLIILTSLCLITLFCGIFYFGQSQPALDEHHLQFYNDQETVKIKGIINKDPEVRDKTTRLYLKAAEIQINQEWQETSGTALVFVSRYAAYSYGDKILVTGKLETPPQIDDFDYKDYLAHQEIYSIMFYPEIEVLEVGKGLKPLEWIYSLRSHLAQSLTKVLSEPQASLAQGVILGIRGTIPSEVRDNFTRSGTAHILAISGLHLAVVAGILLSAGLWFFGRRRYLYIWLALGGVWFYALITGMNPPVVRGAIMASLFLTAELLGRQRSAITPLALAAAVMVGLSPQILWQASFQLSFLAMTGLIFISPSLQTVGRKTVRVALGEDGALVHVANIIADSFSVTLGAIIAVWPVIAYYFGIVSFASPLATLLVLPALPGIIITGALAAMVGLVILPVAQVIGWLAWLLLSYMLLVANGFAGIFVEVGTLSTHLIWAYYLGFTLTLWILGHRQQTSAFSTRILDSIKSVAGKITLSKPAKWVIPPLIVVAGLVSVAALTMPDEKLHVSFLDVGAGDAILIQTPAHQNILIDGGPSPEKVTLALGSKMPFWDRSLDLVVLTHPHSDHLAGLVEVLKRYQVKEVLYPDLGYHSPTYEEWLRVIKENDIKYTLAQAGQEIDLGEGVKVRVLNPRVPLLTGTESDIDNNGVVLHLAMGKINFLFTADIQWEAEFELIIQGASLSSTILKVAHHGADTSTTDEFLAVVNPQLVVIQTGADNKFGHPCPEIMERLEAKISPGHIFRTDKQGTIEFITDGERLWVKVEKNPYTYLDSSRTVE